MALREDPGLSILVAVAVPVLALAIGLLIGRAGPLFRVMQTRIDAVNRILREQITGVRVVRAFVREPYEEQRFEVANAELTDTTTKVGRIMAALFPVVMLVMNLSQVAVLWFGPHRIASGGDLQIGQLSAFLTYLIQILMSVMMASMMFMIAPAGRGVCRADHGGPEHRELGRAAGRWRTHPARAGHRRVRQRVLLLPGSRLPRCCRTSPSPPSPAPPPR